MEYRFDTKSFLCLIINRNPFPKKKKKKTNSINIYLTILKFH